LLAVHAVLRKDGSLGLMLINKDPKNDATVKVKISGAQLAPPERALILGPRTAQRLSDNRRPTAGLGIRFTVNGRHTRLPIFSFRKRPEKQE